MNLELEYYGQNDGTTVPDLVLTGDPGTDNAALTAAGYKSGAIVAIKHDSASTKGLVVIPVNGAQSNTGTTGIQNPYGFLLLGAGQFSSSITPSGSGKTPVVRAFPKFKVPSTQVVGTPKVGELLYAGSTADAGKFTATPAGTGLAGNVAVGICTHAVSASEPWLGVASLL